MEPESTTRRSACGERVGAGGRRAIDDVKGALIVAVLLQISDGDCLGLARHAQEIKGIDAIQQMHATCALAAVGIQLPS